MPYGKSEDLSKLKKKIEEQMPGVNVDNMSENDMKKILMSEINKNNSIDPSVKDKINRGDIDGLKEDLINYLSRSQGGDGTSEKLVKMLKNNDMDGLKNQLMGMLLGGMNSQKKNEINEDSTPAESPINSPFAELPGLNGLSGLSGLLDNNAILNTVMGKMFEFNKSDERVIFLNSMRPFVTEKRQKSIDDCVKILSLIAFFERFTNKVGK